MGTLLAGKGSALLLALMWGETPLAVIRAEEVAVEEKVQTK